MPHMSYVRVQTSAVHFSLLYNQQRTLVWVAVFSYFCLCFSSALDIRLKDDSFPEADFEIARGNLNVIWERIAPYPCGK